MRTAVLLLFCCLPAFGQTAPKTGVKFSCTCTDPVGARYATAVRDLIALSPRYKPAVDFIDNPEKETRTFNMGIRVVSLDPQVGSPANGTAVSIVITWGAIYMASYIQICTSNSVRTCAENTIADLDAQGMN